MKQNKDTKTYNKIRNSISNWSKWKKDYCNENLLISTNSKKID